MKIENFSIFEIDFIYFLPKGKGIWKRLEKLVRVLEDFFQISRLLPRKNLPVGNGHLCDPGKTVPSDLLYILNISFWTYYQQVFKRATRQKFFSAFHRCAKLADWRKNGQKWRFLHIFDDFWPWNSNEHRILLNSISSHGFRVISVIQPKNGVFKSVKMSHFGPKRYVFLYI